MTSYQQTVMQLFKSDLKQLLPAFLNFGKRVLVSHWRSLLLLAIGVYLPLQVFGLLAEEVWDEGGFIWDTLILQGIHATAQPQLDSIAVTLTQFGSSTILFPVISAIALVMLLRRRWRSLIYLLTTVIGSAIINRAVKLLMHRVRPELWTSPAPELDFGFPSGHAMNSMTLVAALVILTWGSPWCLLVLIGGSLYAIAIAWTRLYLGVHFPSDILAGWMVSVAWAIGVSFLVRLKRTAAIAPHAEQPKNETTLLPEESGEKS
ncbi:MAG: hypothetical protein N4J56_002097 [Chroococcidiopsis sp. SAG 2025]|nr:hypothetical protein [Chroococcidiopsis sp. SAG 2025]